MLTEDSNRYTQGSAIRRRGPVAAAAVFIAALALLMLAGVSSFATSAPAAPRSAGQSRHLETATLAAGCFWSMEAMYKQLKGVESVQSGYAGGTKPHPSYEEVETGTTGYAETVNITFDPSVISYRDLVRVLLISRDPTTRDRQGNDEGPQYRSVIFYRTPQQKRDAEAEIRRVTGERVWSDPIVTAVTPFTTFYPAESYHTDYYRLHPYESYCRYVIAPEIAKFRATFKDKLKR